MLASGLTQSGLLASQGQVLGCLLLNSWHVGKGGGQAHIPQCPWVGVAVVVLIVTDRPWHTQQVT